MRPRSRLIIGALSGVVLLAALLVATHNVPTSVTSDDKHYAAAILEQAGYDPTLLSKTPGQEFESEVRAVVAVQDAVLEAAPKHSPISMGHEREPKDVFELKHGLCYDRSRAIEKVLDWLGYETRHVSVYSTKEMSRFWALLKPQVDSHAVTEVMTRKGWMVVDSNAHWIGLDRTRDAISLDDMQDGPVREWAPESRDEIQPIFTGPFVHISGLYSRHGGFYPPYTPIPDFNVTELLENFSD
jgi:transglutaminase superfamily protein